MEMVLFGSLLVVFHAYLGYPITLYLLGLLVHRKVHKVSIEPEVSLIIAACNEEARIAAKLENVLALDYPRKKLEVVVVSDGSSDKTNEIVRGFADQGVTLVECLKRRGKEYAQKEALARSNGDIVVFSDVATMMDHNGLSEIVANFADSSVGCVSSVDRVVGRDGTPCGEGLYVRYEMWLRDLESRVCSLVGLSGSFFAARREVCGGLEGNLQSDFRTLLASVEFGLRGVSDPAAIGYYRDLADNSREFDRKVRTVLRGITVFFRNIGLLNPFRYGLFSYQFFCHKLLRWLVPLFLVSALVANAVLCPESEGYFFFLLLQLLFYGVALVGRFPKLIPSRPLFRVPVYFLSVNLAIVVAWWQFLQGKRLVMWTPSER